MPDVSAATASSAPVSPEQDSVPHARQIVSVNEDGTSFTLDAKALDEIFSKVPQDTKVAIISVVGAFRTGKSFLLDLILRYLRYGSPTRIIDVAEGVSADSEDWKKWAYEGLDGSAEATLEGNSNEAQTHGEMGFSWRAGHKRNTTGIWMWETPFIRRSEACGEDIAVFLVDTQGMFDSETSQMLTASIFGLSTLLSSYQIYNVDKRVQEDNLQHLALFTEYGRMALMSEKTSKEALSEKLSPKKNDSKSTKPSQKDTSTSSARPFQNLDFLVRDWQEFMSSESLLKKRTDMAQYTTEVFSSRTQKDLAYTREQILSCFDRLQCFMLPHPGLAVTKRDYDGSIAAIDTEFLALLTTYLDDLFDPNHLVAKKIHSIPVTARELLTYIKAYAKLFRKPKLVFPEAKTLLAATAEANNINTRVKALRHYTVSMDKLVGPKCKYVQPNEFAAHHTKWSTRAIKVFDNGAIMGLKKDIVKYREELVANIEKERKTYEALNNARIPYSYAIYALPIVAKAACVGLAVIIGIFFV